MSIDWVIETCRKNEIVDYKNYCVFKNALNSVKTPKKRTREENQQQQKISLANSSINISTKSFENDLNAYFSQYLPKDEQTRGGDDKRAILQETDLNQVKPQQQQQSFSNNSTLQLINAEKAHAQRQLFSNKKFTIIGFEADEIDEIKNVIVPFGGFINIFEDNEEPDEYLTKPADFFLLPMTIAEPLNFGPLVTVFWLRKCIDQKVIHPVQDHVLFQPIPRFNNDRSLTGCVVTISGFLGGYEKDTLTSLCQLLGAVTQNSFSSKQTPTVYPNTHLLCKTADGPKYTASKTWKIPAVSLEWLVDSCVSGMKADEKKYLIESGNNYQEFIQNLDKIRRNLSDSQQNQSDLVSTIKNDEMTTTILVNENKSDNDMTVDYESPKINQQQQAANNSSLLNDSVSKKPRLEPPCTPDISKITINDNNVFKTPQQCDTVLFKTPLTVEANGKRLIQQGGKTPNTPLNPRLQQIKQTEAAPSSYSTPDNSSLTGGDWETPLWLKSPNDPKRKNFVFALNLNPDFDRNIHLIQTPNPMDPSKPLTPLNEVVIRTFKQAALNAQIPGYYDCSSDSPVYLYDHEVKKLEAERQNKLNLNENQNTDDVDENDIPSATPFEVKEMKEILKNTNVYISKKLAKSQSELNTIVELLGGDFMWIYNKTCTHLVYSGKLTDNNKELRLAKEQNISIVSPYWLYACQEQKQRVDESLFPCTYNPSKCAVVTSRTPKVSLNERQQQYLSTPVTSKSSQQPPRKTTTQNIIKNYCSDEDDDDEAENLLANTNSQLLKKSKQSSSNNNKIIPPSTIPDDEDSEMNLIDSQFLRNCDNQCKNNQAPTHADIPDSIDIKNDFLNQLQDKLANIGNNKTSNNSLNTSNMLNEHQIMNELNKSGRSKWGNTFDNDFDTQQQNPEQNNNNEDILCVRILDDHQNQNKTSKSLIKNKKRRQFMNINNGGDDDDEELNNETNSDNIAAHSQIQMTLWKDTQNHNIRRKK